MDANNGDQLSKPVCSDGGDVMVLSSGETSGSGEKSGLHA